MALNYLQGSAIPNFLVLVWFFEVVSSVEN